MAEEKTTLLIDVKVSSEEALKRQQDLKLAIEAQKKALNDLTAGKKDAELSEAKMSEKYIIAESNLKNLNTQLSANQRVLTQMQGVTTDVSGAFQELTRRTAEATQRANDIGAAYGKNSDQFKKASTEANEMKQEMKDISAASGNYQLEVGNYMGKFGGMIQSVQDFTTANGGLAGSFKAGGQAVMGFGKQLLALLANPIVAIIAAIAGAVMLMVNAMKSNGAATEKFNQILAPMKMLLNTITAALGQLVSVILDGVLAFGKMANAVMSLIPGLDKVAERNNEAIKLEREKQKLIRAGIVDKAADAKEELRISELRKKINQAAKYSVEQRLAFAREVDKAEKALAMDDANRANNNLKNFLNNMKQQGKAQKDYTVEELQQLTDLQAAKYAEQQSYFDKTKKTASREASLFAEIEADKNAKIEANNAEKDKKDAARTAKKTEQIAADKKAEEDRVKALKDTTDKEIANLNLVLEMEKLKQEERLAGQKLTDEQLYANKVQALKDSTANELAILKVKTEQEKVERLSGDAAELLELKDRLAKKTITKAEFDIQKKALDDKQITDGLASEQSAANQSLLINQQLKTNLAISDAEFELLKQENKKLAAATDLQNELEIADLKGQSLLELKLAQLEVEYQAEIAAAEKQGADTTLIEQKYSETKKKLNRAEIAAKMDMASNFAGNIAEIFGKNTKVGKVAASAQIAIDTAKGAMAAFTSTASIPVVGPALGIAAAGAVIAKGVRSIKDVWAVKSGLPGDNGGGGGSVPTGAASGAAPASVTGGLVARSSGQTQQAATTQAMDTAMKSNPVQPVLVTADLTTVQNQQVQIKSDNSL